jgi:hypothetical protein
VSNIESTTTTLQLTGHCLTCNGVSAPLRHHKAALFLAGLLAAAQQGRPYTKVEFLQAWSVQDAQARPDRTAVKRTVLAVRAALAAVLPDGASRIETAARGLTTGPWRLRLGAQERWQVQGGALPAPELDPEPSFTDAPNPMAWCAAANALAIADAMLLEGQYAECAALLQAQLLSLPLSPAAQCLWRLRQVKVLRRLGHYAGADEVLAALALQAATLPWRLRAFVQGKTQLLQSRGAFDGLPLQASLGLDFGKLRTAIDTAPNITLQWEWCNLRALANRRQIDRSLSAGAARPALAAMVQTSISTFGAAYFWASLAEDSYHCQAIACNFAHNLHWLHSKGLAGLEASDAGLSDAGLSDAQGGNALAASLAWFKLAHTLVDRFSLPQDSAWDFLMLGDIYLSSQEAQALIEKDTFAWPEQTNPAKEAFYTRALGLSRSHGNPRQEVMALNQLAGHLHIHNQLARRQTVRVQRNTLMALHPALVEDMVMDGLVLY